MYYVIYFIVLCFQKRRIGITIRDLDLVLINIRFLKSSFFGNGFAINRFFSLLPFSQMDRQRPFFKLTPFSLKGFPLYARS